MGDVNKAPKKSGFAGGDKAKKIMGMENYKFKEAPAGMKSRQNEKMRLYKKGGKVEKIANEFMKGHRVSDALKKQVIETTRKAYKKGGPVSKGHHIKTDLRLAKKYKMPTEKPGKPQDNSPTASKYKKGGPVKSKKMFGGGLLETLGPKPMPSPAHTLTKRQPLNSLNVNMKKGGPVKRVKKMFGGGMPFGMNNTFGQPTEEFGQKQVPFLKERAQVMPNIPIARKKGGHNMKKCSTGGYEKMMVGEKRMMPRPGAYEAQMKGESSSHRAVKKGGHQTKHKKMAMGGPGKMRKGEMTSDGRQA